ncbi:YkgJ family cysteine cluster protein [Thiorhodococcus minor]|uniref:YkgJ family cysteine cluster protein n=1 Tax=Thiorhodococcus minor TaxID=57489 RepID=A0A6M0K0N4_9GAMM|nr:YkgJ family cysteine cluster protein [Thiorhodococcus minor]NEV61865.1 YkgJ family cysteine cluster protein [Thiorhodococcus minor]
MTDNKIQPTTPISCDTCAAACCRLEVVCLSEGDIPDQYTTENTWGNTLMARLEDGWCAALNRDTMRCRIYASRPLGCRELELGGEDCLAERARCRI